MTDSTKIQCRCGQLQLEVSGSPIISATCYCNSCRAASERLLALEGALPSAGPDGGTHYVLYRKDRTRFLKGTDSLKNFRLTPDAPTQRVIATCCQTPVFLEFQHGHWLSLYSGLWPDDKLPAVQARAMTSDLPDGWKLPDDDLSRQSHTWGFYARLLGAWIAMGFRVPKLNCVNGELHI